MARPRPGWPSHHFSVPAPWRSGVYIGFLAEGDGGVGGWSLSTVPEADQVPAPVPRASRCAGREEVPAAPLPSGSSTRSEPSLRQTFVHWDSRLIAWLERCGYAVDYCTDLDLHAPDGFQCLSRYQLLLLLSVGIEVNTGERFRKRSWDGLKSV